MHRAGLGRPILSLLAALVAWVAWIPDGVRAQTLAVRVQGTVKDPGGAPLAGAVIRILESDLSATTGADGAFEIQGGIEVGVLPRAVLPGGAVLDAHRGRLRLVLPPAQAMEMLLVSPEGKSRRRTLPPGRSERSIDAEAWLAPGAGVWFLRLGSGPDSRTYRLVRAGRGLPVRIVAEPGRPSGSRRGTAHALRKSAAAADTPALVLEASLAGYLAKRRPTKPVETSLPLVLLPATATYKERAQDFIGAGNTFRLAFLKKEPGASRKHVLHYVDLDRMTGDSLDVIAFPDSRGPANPESTPFGANVPAWSPDGRALAYEIGAEAQTVNNVSQIWIQPLSGSRFAGPGFPATNPRWWAQGGDTALVWCTSGREDAWKDTSSRTLRQRFSGGALTGQPETLAKGSFNGGLAGADTLYLSAAYRHGMMLELPGRTLRSFHIYPRAAGGPEDSLQACNASISPDPAAPSRMLFLDFGVPAGEAPYPNVVRPRHYAQHQMILIGDFRSEAPGRLVDFIDTPAEELAREKTWDDPEWSNHRRWAVATTRDPDGDLSVPSEPRPTQPDIYIIDLDTKAAFKALSGDHFTMPALWIGPRP